MLLFPFCLSRDVSGHDTVVDPLANKCSSVFDERRVESGGISVSALRNTRMSTVVCYCGKIGLTRGNKVTNLVVEKYLILIKSRTGNRPL